MSLAMSKDQREQFLAGLHVGVLAIPDPGRGPLNVPIWYGYEPGGEIWLVTGRNSRKGRLLAQGVRVAFVAQSEQAPYRYVSVEGPVVSIGASDVERHERPLARRYLGRELGDRYVESTGGADARGANALVRIRPERWLSGDYSKEYSLGGTPD